MATSAQIDEQVQLEREAIRCGIDKLTRNTAKLQEKEYASATIYGAASIRAAQELVAAAIQDTFWKIRKGQNGKHFRDIQAYLSQYDNEEDSHALANIALKRTFDLVFSTKKKDGKREPNTTQNICIGIGHAVEAECQIRWYEQQDPELFSRIKRKYWLSTTGTYQKQSVARLMMNRHDYNWKTWSTELRLRLGGWLLELVTTTTGWFEKEVIAKNNRKQPLVVPSEAYTRIQEQLMNEAALFAPMSWPMLIEPNDWTNERAGGYLLNEVQRGNELVRHGNPCLKQPETPLAFLNKLQKVPYRVCPFMYGVAKELQQKGYQLGKFNPLQYAANWPMPTPPVDIETNAEARKTYCRDRTEAENARKKYQRSMHVKTTATLEVADRFIKYDRYFIPWSFDYRGRTYPIPHCLTPQDTDFGKSLIRFADEAFLTEESEEWIKFQVATTYGLDKKTMAQRLEWADNNHELISKVATDPIAYLSEWEGADEPWQFLAACREMYNCLIDCNTQHTGLPIAVDATCSGLQILAGLARDLGTAKLVNVVPGDKPQDAYKTVLDAMEDIPERLATYMDRSVTKRSVMTIPYNATLQSSRQYIKAAIEERMPKDSQKRLLVDPVTPDEATKLAKSLYAAMEKIAPGPLKVMTWIGKEMTAAIKRGNSVIQWQTPSGFIVYQKRNHLDTKVIELSLMGRTQMRVAVGEKGPNPRKHKSSGAPNLIHSLDSSLLHLAFQRFDAPFSVIHDSVLCRATDMSILSCHVRETYMHLFAEHDYLKDFAEQIGAETEPPIIDTLEPESVIESTYFFC